MNSTKFVDNYFEIGDFNKFFNFFSDHQEAKSNGNDNPDENDCNSTNSGDDTTVDSSLPPADKKQKRITDFQRMKANCKPDELEKLQLKCETLVRDCIAGLLVQLSNDDFQAMESKLEHGSILMPKSINLINSIECINILDELNRAVCWYLTCDRYFEDGPIEQRAFPWGLVFILVLLLSFGVCFCYYIIWILFE